jgi:hypothetical protein
MVVEDVGLGTRCGRGDTTKAFTTEGTVVHRGKTRGRGGISVIVIVRVGRVG